MKNLYIILLAVLFLSGCYKDKGNYDYHPVGEIIISGIDAEKYYYVYLGEPFTMPEPELSFTDSTYAHDDLTYQWRIDNKVISTEKILYAEVALEPGASYYAADFTVKDERTGISYVQKFRVMVSSNFSLGWVWLAENNGRAEMNMVTSNQKFFGNVFTTVNEAELGPHAWQLTEHFSQVGYNWYSGLLTVAGAGSIELDWSSLRKETWMYQEFSGGKFPDGFNPVAAVFTKSYSCVVGDNGKVHIRHSPGGYLYEGRYPSMPYYSDFKISPQVASAYPPAYNVALFFDEKSSSYVYLDPDGALQRFDQVTDEGGAFPVTQMNKDLIFISAVSQQGNNSVFYAVVQDRTTKKYTTQQFEFGISGRNVYLKTISEQDFPDVIDQNTRFAVGYKTTDVWYSKGSVLYKYNRDLNDTPELFKDFKTGAIQAIAFNQYGDQYGVIVQNGQQNDFYWESTDGTTIYPKTGLEGQVKHLIYKVGYGFYYE